MPDGAFSSIILCATTRPSDVESAVSVSADEGVTVRVFGSEAQAAHMTRAMAGTASRARRPFERGEVLGPTNATAPEKRGRQCFWGTSRTSAPRECSLGKFAVSNVEVEHLGPQIESAANQCADGCQQNRPSCNSWRWPVAPTGFVRQNDIGNLVDPANDRSTRTPASRATPDSVPQRTRPSIPVKCSGATFAALVAALRPRLGPSPPSRLLDADGARFAGFAVYTFNHEVGSRSD